MASMAFGVLRCAATVVAVLGFLAGAAPHFGYYFQIQHPDPAAAVAGTGYSYNTLQGQSQNQNQYSYQYQGNPYTNLQAQYQYQYQNNQQQQFPFQNIVHTNVVPLSPPAQLQLQSWPYFFPSPLVQTSIPIPANLQFRIGVISDLDKDSLDGELWHSYLKEGILDLKRNVSDLGFGSVANVTVQWDDSKFHTIKSGLAYSGRGMELSTLNRFNGRLYACDDKTGVVYELPLDQGQGQNDTDIQPIPWAILADGNFEGPSGFKCEWGTIKDGELWIGGHGKHTYNSSGAILSSNDRFIKKITTAGEVTHLDWSENFDKMAHALGVRMPGYVIHEAAGWSDVLQKWVFMPRKVSKEEFDEKRDEEAGSSVMLIADEDFNEIEVVQIGTPEPSEGFSGFKFIPGTGDQYIVALKTTTKETEGDLKSFVLAFDLKGNLLLNETEIATQKYEAIEFL